MEKLGFKELRRPNKNWVFRDASGIPLLTLKSVNKLSNDILLLIKFYILILILLFTLINFYINLVL